ncbi:GP46-like surface antigen, putative [Bodo saltans]|uniref:GP46-like surface antigen, putative n=1 Tax=Bodo saltans TaxID=75058 RepID=A0A0S4KMV2_BODSA|nr:GP46-like surface antigen, putative [Bodo saltans]|eukprot:CUI14209.1 GP46-like surface antigen, putative [Bodo saltans]
MKLLLWIAFVAFIAQEVFSATPEAQRAALLELYNSTGGANWVGCGADWGSTTVPPCSWFGITCDGANVVGLTLVDCGLRGTLPLGLSALSHLQYLELNLNSIFGTLPDWTGFDQLLSVGIVNNSLSGTLPPSWSRFTSLQSLSLQYNTISGPLPAAWGNFTQLQSLQLSHNDLQGTVPSEWRGLIQYSIDLSYNSISGDLPSWDDSVFPDTMGTLDLSNNQISGTLPEWKFIFRVTALILASNKLTGTLPLSWTGANYQLLDVSWNHLTGSIPSWSGNAYNLHLQHNNFSGNLSFLTNMNENVDVIDLSDNSFTGDLPEFQYPNWGCDQLTCKCSMNLQNNFLRGSIPQIYCQLMSNINLAGNCLRNTTLPANCDQNSPSCGIVVTSQRQTC